MVLEADGDWYGEARHYPYGGERWSSGTLLTDYRFTGQREDSSIKLYQMGARWYDPYLNRFLSPDSIIPHPANPQSFNRYMFVLGNPLKYVDPTGHKEEGACPADDPTCDDIQPGDIFLENMENWKILGEWDHGAIVVSVDPENPNHIWIVEAGYGQYVGMRDIYLDAPRGEVIDWVILRPDASQEDRAAAASWAAALAGWDGTTERTETLGEAPFVSMFPFPIGESPFGFLDIGLGEKGYYCFEVIVDAYEAQGVDVTERTQNLEMALQYQWFLSSQGPGGLTISSYTALSMSYALTPVYGVDIYRSSNTSVLAQMPE